MLASALVVPPRTLRGELPWQFVPWTDRRLRTEDGDFRDGVSDADLEAARSRLEATNGGLPLEAALCYESYADVRNPNDS